MKRIAINGFGRIGRLTARNLLRRDDVEIVGINDLTDNLTLAHLFKYDTAQGTFEANVTSDDQGIYVNGKKIHATSIKNPAELLWKELGVDVVLECTGRFVDQASASLHLDAGAGKVVLSAPPKESSIKTIVLGVNDEDINAETKIYSNASCTTNCLAPIVKLLLSNWGIKNGSLNTVHAYTGDQNLQDGPHKDLRRARAAAQNIVPTSTGAAKAVAMIFPEIEGKITSIAVRVPVITGSLIDLTVSVDQIPTISQVNEVFKSAAEGSMKGILQYCDAPIVSSDIIGNSHSSIFDALLTKVNGDMIRVFSWYDNEAGYAQRLADLAVKV